MRTERGLTLIEVLVAMVLLAILGIAIVAFMPMITRNTMAASTDTSESQRAIAIFEHITRDWSNPGAWSKGEIYLADGTTQTVEAYVADQMSEIGRTCTGEVTIPSPERRRVTIVCPASGSLPERIIKAEFGDPSA